MDELGFWTRFVLCAFACWRVTHLLANEDGPGNVVLRIRRSLGDSVVGHAMDCFYCLSLWVAGPLALILVQDLLGWLLAWLALSGVACVIERVSTRGPPVE
jgi:hypothetical protein